MSKNSAKRQRDFVAAKRALGLKRVVLWVEPEAVPDLRLAARQPHALSKLRQEVEAELRPKIELEVRQRITGKLERRTERAMLAQRRAQVRRQQARSNRPPELVRFKSRPPAALRNRLKAAGWLYDPVAAVWHLPNDPDQWPATETMLDELGAYGIERLVSSLMAYSPL